MLAYKKIISQLVTRLAKGEEKTILRFVSRRQVVNIMNNKKELRMDSS